MHLLQVITRPHHSGKVVTKLFLRSNSLRWNERTFYTFRFLLIRRQNTIHLEWILLESSTRNSSITIYVKASFWDLPRKIWSSEIGVSGLLPFLIDTFEVFCLLSFLAGRSSGLPVRGRKLRRSDSYSSTSLHRSTIFASACGWAFLSSVTREVVLLLLLVSSVRCLYLAYCPIYVVEFCVEFKLLLVSFVFQLDHVCVERLFCLEFLFLRIKLSWH